MYIGVVTATVSSEDITDFFPEAKNNLTKITWAHAVNNQTLLEDALKGENLQKNVYNNVKIFSK